MKDFFCGQKSTYSRVITEKDVLAFAELSEDFNPVHIDEKKAQESVFGQRIVHGMLLASFISKVLGTDLPGEGTIYLKQEIKFIKPVYFNDIVTVVVEITEIEKGRAKLTTNIYNQNQIMVVAGNALVKLPSEVNE